MNSLIASESYIRGSRFVGYQLALIDRNIRYVFVKYNNNYLINC